MKDFCYLLAVGLTVLLFLHMLLTPLLQPDREACSQAFSRAYGEYRQMNQRKEPAHDGS